eukprot:TRINITY_DN5386_c0_g1_i6.p1 TRINITY_DN5386_c0_g1~~TRINITY_DN5386_c0_g1_i6.p1  ORF type:complete len:294 (-),score=36.07 TRINITY_DN5386_c0_g1_i6:15-776(-)
MTTSLANSLKMMETFNTVMEKFLVQNIIIRLDINKSTQKNMNELLIPLLITNNVGQLIPSTSFNCKIRSTDSDSQESNHITHKYFLKTGDEVSDLNNSKLDLPIGHTSLTLSISLPGLSKAIFFFPYLGQISLSFSSPGTGHILSCNEAFTIQGIHLCDKKWSTDFPQNSVSQEIPHRIGFVNAKTIRSLFHVPPALGMDSLTFYGSTVVFLKVLSISGNYFDMKILSGVVSSLSIFEAQKLFAVVHDDLHIF